MSGIEGTETLLGSSMLHPSGVQSIFWSSQHPCRCLSSLRTVQVDLPVKLGIMKSSFRQTS